MKKIYNYSLEEDKETLEQFENCYSQNFVVAAALMPDAHKGYVAPIGSVLIAKNFVVPAWVGFDIGCGLIAIRLKGKNIFEKIYRRENKVLNIICARKILGPTFFAISFYTKLKIRD